LKNFSSRAFVIKTVDYGEADSIVTLFTEDRGKLSTFARNAKKSKKRFGTAIDIFNFLNASFSSRKTASFMPNLESISVINYFENIRKNIVTVALASSMVELFNEMTAENVRNDGLFKFLYLYLDEVNSNSVKKSVLPIWQLKFLRMTGLGPNFSSCLSCRKAEASGRNFFVFPMGGTVCSACLSLVRGEYMPLRAETLHILRKEEDLGENILKRIKVGKGASYELKEVVNKFIEFHLGKKLKSFKFMEDLDAEFDNRV
jgi:DNA repair protein RecO (recombination protein O)